MSNPLIAALDIETTGLNEPEHRIIEVYIDLIRDDKVIWSYEQRIDPERSIEAKAQAVHKISMSDLLGKPTWSSVGPVVAKILDKADVYMGHNGLEFDGPFLMRELKRIGLTMPDRPMVDTMLDGLWATPDGKKPNLRELCFACGIEYDPALAHEAKYDVQKMTACFFAARQWGFYDLDILKESSVAA